MRRIPNAGGWHLQSQAPAVADHGDAVVQNALALMQVSATPVRRGVAFLMSSGGGALLATGYFLSAFQAETQKLDAIKMTNTAASNS